MPLLLNPLAARKLLHPGDIHTVHTSPVVRQQRGQRPPDDLGAIDDADRMPEQPVPIRQDRVVDVEVLEDLDVRQRRAGQDALLAFCVGVQEPNILVHVEDVAVAQALDVLLHVHDLLQVLVLPVVEDRVVHDDAVDGGVGVRGQDGFLDAVAGRLAEGVAESAAEVVLASRGGLRSIAGNSLLLTRLLCPLRVHQRRGVAVRQEAHQVRWLLQRLHALLHLREQAIGDVLGQHNLAGGWGRLGGVGHECGMRIAPGAAMTGIQNVQYDSTDAIGGAEKYSVDDFHVGRAWPHSSLARPIPG